MEPKVTIKDGYTEIECYDARQFLDELDELNPRWGESDWEDNVWLFRGHSNADWKLLPSAYREDGIINRYAERYYRHYSLSKMKHPDGRLLTEREQRRLYYDVHNCIAIDLLDRFISTSASVGIKIPVERGQNFFGQVNVKGGVGLQIRDNFLSKSNLEERMYPFREINTVRAQHHGIPTKLLDWSRRSFKAAFFATYGINEKDNNDNSRRITVWAINRRALNNTYFVAHYPLLSDVGFLLQQEGAVTFRWNDKKSYMEHGNFPSLDDAIRDINKPNLFLKFTLPISEICELKKLLRKKNIYKASLMPSEDNVTEDILTSDIFDSLVNEDNTLPIGYVKKSDLKDGK